MLLCPKWHTQMHTKFGIRHKLPHLFKKWGALGLQTSLINVPRIDKYMDMMRFCHVL